MLLMNLLQIFDHIIPQKAFKSSSMANKELLRDNIYNLGLFTQNQERF
jgi:hypothetical protein